MSCGAALNHVLSALAAAGFAGDIVRLPEDGSPEVVARLRRGPAMTVTGQDRADWLAAGEALSDVWLTLTARGLAASPISEVVEVPQARTALRRLLGWVGHPAIALRIGYPAGSDAPPRSVRRSGTDVIGLPGDP
jgi:hypothetical protein